MLSDLATRRRACAYGRRRGAREALLIDVRKARFQAYVEGHIYVALPPEVSEPGMCAKLNRSLYGARAAPARWGALCTITLQGF
eukprot:12857059-Alexandrium_andersonii.AAC.1